MRSSAGRAGLDTRERTERSEAEHWDAVAGRHGDEFAHRTGPGSSADPLHDAHIRALGDLGGCRLLDLGCGMGLWSTELAEAGAHVVSLDVSYNSVATARRRAEERDVADRVTPMVASAHALPFRDGAFEAVSGQLILHHLDVNVAAREIARVLRPGGRAVFTENSARSATLMFARRFLCGRFGIPKWSTPDEYPLRRRQLSDLRRQFGRMETLHPRFDWFFLLNAKLFGFRNARANRVCGWLDRAVPTALPFVRRSAYYQVIVLYR